MKKNNYVVLKSALGVTEIRVEKRLIAITRADQHIVFTLTQEQTEQLVKILDNYINHKSYTIGEAFHTTAIATCKYHDDNKIVPIKNLDINLLSTEDGLFVEFASDKPGDKCRSCMYVFISMHKQLRTLRKIIKQLNM